jgi:DNA polymerase-3 subunit delta'
MSSTRILGHRQARAQLRHAAERDTLHHAYLFSGPRGVGKRRVATELAMLVNCEAADPASRPCGECATCKAIHKGVHPDVIVIEPDLDKASRTIPIEAIREVIRQAQYHRYGARRRFVIVDPAEAMLEPAQNALLKTLEEPPAGTGFLVITHNARALLPTIRSRCQLLRFGAVPMAEIREWLLDKGLDEADAVARLAQGCPGRALYLAEGGLEARAQLRDQVIDALSAPLAEVYEFAQNLTQGARQDWAGEVDLVFEIIEDLLRDATVRAAGAEVPLLDEQAGDILVRLAVTWPQGLVQAARALSEARDDLEVYVTGRTAIEALVTAIQRELGPIPQ